MTRLEFLRLKVAAGLYETRHVLAITADRIVTEAEMVENATKHSQTDK